MPWSTTGARIVVAEAARHAPRTDHASGDRLPIAKARPVTGILTQKDARTEDPGAGDLYKVGCAARILKVIKLAKDNFSVILQGVSRFEVSTFDGSEPFL